MRQHIDPVRRRRRRSPPPLAGGAASRKPTRGRQRDVPLPGQPTTQNTISAQEAAEAGCKKIDGAPITVIQTVKPRAAGTAVPAVRRRLAARPASRIDPVAAARPRQRRPAHPRRRAEARGGAAGRAAEGVQQRRARAAGNEQNYQKYLDRVAEMKRQHRAQGDRHRRAAARAAEAAAISGPVTGPASGAPAPRGRRRARPRYEAFDLLATMVAVVTPDGECVFANAVVRERARPVAPQRCSRGSVFDWFVDPQVLRETVAAVSRNDFSTSRFEAQLSARPAAMASRCRCT